MLPTPAAAVRHVRYLYRRARSPRFGDHYDGWRTRRIAAITDHYGAGWFAGRSVLEVGCGYGDIGAAVAKLGASVTCSDAVAGHLKVVARRHPEVRIMRADLDAGWPFADRYDLLLHLGVLYHLEDPEAAIRQALTAADHIVLETEVSDSDDPAFNVRTAEKGYDQAFNHVGCRPSPAFVERVLTDAGRAFDRVTDDRCNHWIHRYDWPVENTGAHESGRRRMWFVGP